MRTESPTGKRNTALVVVLSLVIVVAVGSLVSRGCGSGDDHMVTRPVTQADVQKRITQIENDPHMPQFAKDAAIGQLKSRMQSKRP